MKWILNQNGDMVRRAKDIEKIYIDVINERYCIIGELYGSTNRLILAVYHESEIAQQVLFRYMQGYLWNFPKCDCDKCSPKPIEIDEIRIKKGLFKSRK